MVAHAETKIEIGDNPYLGSFSLYLPRGSRVTRTMPGQIRVQYPGAIYYVMSRGDRREGRIIEGGGCFHGLSLEQLDPGMPPNPAPAARHRFESQRDSAPQPSGCEERATLGI